MPASLFLALVCGIAVHLVAETQPPALGIEGGILIAGYGRRAGAGRTLVIIQGNRISGISRKGQASYPANAQIIKAGGKFLLPDPLAKNPWPLAVAARPWRDGTSSAAH
jgi:hypothetical protein